MGWKSKASVVAYLTLSLAAVSAPTQAAETCRTGCDNRHIECAKSKSEDVCMPQWRQCKMACSGGQKAVSPIATPVKVTTTTTIAPDPKSGSKVVTTKTKIGK